MKFNAVDGESAEALERFLARLDYVAADATGDAGWSDLRETLGPDERIRAFYLATGPDLFCPIAKRLGAEGLATLPLAHHRRKTDRPRRRERRRDQQRHRLGLPRERDLPHRPLSRQGVGAEPHGAAFRQRPARAGLEQRAYRPRADHGGRDARRRGPRRLLRRVRRDPRHGAEPYDAAPVPRRHGAAEFDAGRLAAGREAEGAEGARADRRLERRRPDRARAVSRRLRRRRSGSGLPARRGQAREQHRDLRGDEDRHRQLALGGRAVLPSHRQAAAAALLRDRRRLPPRAARHLRHAVRFDPGQPPGHPRAAGRGHQALDDGQGAGSWAACVCSTCRST